MKKKLISITLSFEDKFNNKLLKCWSILKNQYKIKYISSRSKKPHISLLSGYVNSTNKIINILTKKDTKPFYLNTRGLGLFFSEKPLLYIRWQQNKDIIDLYKVLDKELNLFFIEKNSHTKFSNWIPKTTLAYKDLKFKDLKKIEKKLRFINIEKKVLIKKIDLMVVDEKKGEKILFTKSL
jgi:hypothetical protein